MFLVKQGKLKSVKPIIEDAIKLGIMIDGMESIVKEAYAANRGAEKGFDSYFNNILEEGRHVLSTKQKKLMIKQAAPEFTLMNLSG